MKKANITNKKNQNIVVIIDEAADSKGLVFVMHGLGGFKGEAHIKVFAEAFNESGFTVIRFDATNSCGESDGGYENATVTNYFEDLEDVIEWAKTQEFYQEPFCLVGHSIGSLCVALYAENHPKRIKALAPISAVVSGKFSVETSKYKKTAEEWEKTGWRITESVSQPGLIKKLKWSHVEDRLKYDLLPKVQNLTMSVLMIVGDQDDGTPLEHQKILYEQLPGKKEIHVIKNAPHSFIDEGQLKEIKEIFLKWIDDLD